MTTPTTIIPSERLVYTIADVMRITGLGRSSVYALIAQRRLAKKQLLTNRIGVTRQSVLDYLDSCPTTEVR